MTDLSPTMIECVEFMRRHDNKLHRHPGGFWADATFNRNRGGTWFGTSTIEALVSRGVAVYVRWHKRKRHKSSFPVEAQLTADYL